MKKRIKPETMDPGCFYKRNIEALGRVAPAAAGWIDDAENDGGYRLVTTERGLPNLEVLLDEGRRVRLYSDNDPYGKICSEIEKQRFLKQDFSCLIGFGLGYLAMAICNKMETGHKILVVEPHRQILKIAFQLIDFSGLINTGIMVFVYPESRDIRSMIMDMDDKFLTGKMLVVMESYCTKLSDKYEPLKLEVEKAGRVKTKSLVTAAGGMRHYLRSMVMNIPTILHSASVNSLKGKFPDVPAIIIGSGPSLKKNVHLLSRAKGKVVTIALAQGLKSLLATGFKPEIVVSADPYMVNFMQVRGVYDLARIPLIYTNSLNYKIAASFQDKRFYIPRFNKMDQWLSRFIKAGKFHSHGTGAVISALNTAIMMGCNPIIFIGQDLSYETHTHFEGIDFNKDINHDDLNTMIMVKGIDGRTVPTSENLEIQKTQIEQIIAETKAQCINATEGGADIEGTKVMALTDVIDKYCRVQHPVRTMLNNGFQLIQTDIEGLVGGLGKLKKEVKQIFKLSSEGIQLNVDLYRCIIGGKEREKSLLANMAKRNVEITDKINSMKSTAALLSYFTLKEQRIINSRELNPENKNNKADQTANMLKRNRIYLEGMKNVSGLFNRYLNKIFPLLKAKLILTKRLAQNEKDPLTWYRLGFVLAGQGFYRNGAAGFLKAYRLGKKDIATYYNIGKSYRQMESYKKAQYWFEQVVKINPDYKNAARCLKCIKGHSKRLDDLCRRYMSENNFVYTINTAEKWKKFCPDSNIPDHVIDNAREKYMKHLQAVV